MSATHYIKKQNVELIFPSEDSAEEQWDSLIDFHKDEAHRVMADVFDRLVPAHQWVRIDSLEINLGKLSIKSFRQDYLDLLRSSLAKAITTAIGNEQKVLQADPVSVWETMIIHYLKYGTILWETVLRSPSLMGDNKLPLRKILEEKIVERLIASQSFTSLLAHTIRENKNAMQRWVRQFSLSFHQQVKNILISNFSGTAYSLIEKYCELIELVIKDNQMSYGVIYEKSQSIKWSILFPGASISATTLIMEWIDGRLRDSAFKKSLMLLLERSDDTDKLTLLKGLINFPSLLNKEAGEQLIIPALLDNIITARMAALSINKEDDYERNNRAIQINQQHKTGKQKTNEAKQEMQTGNKQTETGNDIRDNKIPAKELADTNIIGNTNDNEIYINNAGMVILAPFLEPFFAQAGINISDGLADDQEASLGIQLLQLLCTDIWDEEEHQLALNKILCGRPPEWPGYRIHKMPVTAKQDCAELLESVIQHWSILKNTSPAGLQETFLQREGKLFFKDEQWQLFIENKTTDILLESIPWGYSVIKHPWMKYPLYVNW